jgi:hypothetical protein
LIASSSGLDPVFLASALAALAATAFAIWLLAVHKGVSSNGNTRNTQR